MQVEAAAREANATEFIDKLPEGFQTVVSQVRNRFFKNNVSCYVKGGICAKGRICEGMVSQVTSPLPYSFGSLLCCRAQKGTP